MTTKRLVVKSYKRLIVKTAKLTGEHRERKNMIATLIGKTEYEKEKELYFYSNLEALMAEKGLSIAELSERTGVAQSTIRSLIRGRLKRLDSISTGKLTQFFQCKLDELYAMKWE